MKIYNVNDDELLSSIIKKNYVLDIKLRQTYVKIFL